MSKKKKKKKIFFEWDLLGKDKLNAIKVLITKASTNLYISHDKFVSRNNVFRE